MTLRNSDRQIRSLMIVDDDILFCDSVRILFKNSKTDVATANTIAEARELAKHNAFDAVLLDNNLPDGDGVEVIPDILQNSDATKIILATAYPSFDNAVRAIRNGGYDYISKPVDLDELQATLERAFEASRLQAVEQVARYQDSKQRKASVLIGFEDPKFNIQGLIEKAALTTAPVLITGETGTGKNIIAKMIHNRSHNIVSPMININCAALPETLIEAELFGAEKGSYTGAVQSRKGIFELADGGTLFLDEIGEMPASLQAKLLTVLEDKSVRRIGSDKDRPLNVRILAATNAEPERSIAAGTFRSDLFYRLSVIRIHVPPLRERQEDILPLCRHFIEQLSPGRRIHLPESELSLMMRYTFPGNVRELRNIIERCIILQEGDTIYPSKILEMHTTDIPAGKDTKNDTLSEAAKNSMTLAELEERYIITVFDDHSRNIARTAAALDISLSTMKRKLQAYGIRSGSN